MVSAQELKTEARRLGPGLAIYKQPKGEKKGSPNWYARVTLDVGGRRVHIQTTGTSDPALAASRAQAYYAELLIQKHAGIVPEGRVSDRGLRFDVLADCWLDELHASIHGDDRKRRRYHDHRKIMTAPNGLVAFFGRRDVRTITPKLIGDYLEAAEQGSRQGSFRPTTKKNHLSTLSKFLNWVADLGRLERVPRMPTIRTKDNPRPAFQDWEYELLLTGCEEAVRYHRLSGEDDLADQWQELLDFVIFMFGSFLRPSEWADLRQKHVEIFEGECTYLRIAVAKGKTGSRPVVTMPAAVAAYKRIRERDGIDPDRHLFLSRYPNRATAKERMADRFNDLLELTGLACDAEGRKRVLYSLRHTALTLRLIQGDHVEMLPLARNAGTSVRMLDRFYCSHVEAEQKIANLQSFKPRPAAAPEAKGPSGSNLTAESWRGFPSAA